VRYGGVAGKANVGMSNDKTGEIPVRRKTKGSSIDANQIRVSRDLRRSRKAKLMDNRLIFLYLCMLRGSDGVWESPRADGIAR
jgi:hypothetical protein